MSRLDEVITQFSRSIDRLESALAGRRAGEAVSPSEADLQREIERLRDENRELQRELTSTRAENDRLASLADTIAGQLDGAIEDVQAVLEKAK